MRTVQNHVKWQKHTRRVAALLDYCAKHRSFVFLGCAVAFTFRLTVQHHSNNTENSSRGHPMDS